MAPAEELDVCFPDGEPMLPVGRRRLSRSSDSSSGQADAEVVRLHGSLLPCFADPPLEAAFQTERFQRTEKRGGMVADVLLGIVSLVFVATFVCHRGATTSFMCLNFAVTIVAMGILVFMFRYKPELASLWYDPFLCCVALHWVVAGSMTADRIASLLQVEVGLWQPARLEEASKLLHISGSLAAVVLFVRPSLRWCLFFINTAIPAYSWLVLAFGSAEYQHLSQVFQTGDVGWMHSLPSTVLQTAGLLYVLSAVFYLSRRIDEHHDRHRFATHFATRKRLDAEKRYNRELRDRQKELEKFASALEHGPDGGITPKVPGRSPATGTAQPKEGDSTGSAPAKYSQSAPCFLPHPVPPKKQPSGNKPEPLQQVPVRRTVPPPPRRPEGFSIDVLKLPEDMRNVNERLAVAMHGRTSNWERIHNMATNIRNPDYTLKEFFDDCVASFPELALFTEAVPLVECQESPTASGRSAEAEYQRTIGALFAVYWLFRLGFDGKISFCYGVDEDWMPNCPPEEQAALQEMSSSPNKRRSRARSSEGRPGHSSGLYKCHSEGPGLAPRARHGNLKRRSSVPNPSGASFDQLVTSISEDFHAPGRSFFKMDNSEKRSSFLSSTDWTLFEQLVNDAGCRDLDRIMALLCLTAFHDIMKITELLPTVQQEHAPYRGYGANVVINDHDTALCYIMEYFPSLLPSYEGLPLAGQKAALFTQGALNFNFGWFVQAEAPPGLTLSGFKAAIQKGALAEDIGLYFLHWITDLAGAQPTPLGGAEMFVLKFPHAVLASFLRSMPHLNHLHKDSETEVVEEYLIARWKKLAPEQPLPSGDIAAAHLRLAVMALNYAAVEAFEDLSEKDKTLMASELARTGCAGQRYECVGRKLSDLTDSVPLGESENKDGFPGPGGPAMLVYYGPALLQKHVDGQEDLTSALRILCEVMRAGRKLFPLQDELENTTVILQIAALKATAIKSILRASDGEARKQWVLIRQNDKEAVVELRSASGINELCDNGTAYRIMDFGR